MTRFICFSMVFNFLIVAFAKGQVKLSFLESTKLPPGIKYEGKIRNAVRWTDAAGDNIVITSETGAAKAKDASDESEQDAALYAYHYIMAGDSVRLTWKVNDHSKACPVDINVNFIKNSFAVTDLDKNGKAEVWLMYRIACRGDVSPAVMKIIMYEDDKKYAVRGTNKVKVSEREYSGGAYKMDEAFEKAPEAFRIYAAALWKKNIMETWE
jgi:hypothetical protein